MAVTSSGFFNHYLTNTNPPSLDSSNDLENSWKIEKIVAAIQKPDACYYQVKWVGYLWQSEDTLQQQVLDSYWQNQTDRSQSVITQIRDDTVSDGLQLNNKQLFKTSDNETEEFDDIDDKECDRVKSLSGSQSVHSPYNPAVISSQGISTTLSGLCSLTQTNSSVTNTSVNTFSTETSLSPTALTTTAQVLSSETTTTATKKDELSKSIMLPAQGIFPARTHSTENPFQTVFNRMHSFEEGSSAISAEMNHALDNSVALGESTARLDNIPSSANTLEHSKSSDDGYLPDTMENIRTSVSDKTTSILDFTPSYMTDTFANFTMPMKAEEKRFKCDTCEKCFGRKTSLQRHALIHTGEKPWQCNYCEKSFNQNSILQRHMLIHGDVKMFQCEICNKTFIEKSALRRHCDTHNDMKPWKCPTCGKDFRLKEYLAKHELLHKGVKPYICKICARSFADSSAFKRHCATHVTPTELFACPDCLKHFKNVRSLKRHRVTCKVVK